MDIKQNSVWLLPLLAIVTAPFWWSPAGKMLKPRGDFDVPPPPEISPYKSFIMEQVVVVQNRGDREEFILKAARINSGIHEDVLDMEEVEAQLYNSSDLPTVLTGGEAFYNTSREIITVLDNVRVRTPEGRMLTTEALRYLVKYQYVKTAAPVLLTGENLQVAGSNLSYDLGANKLRLGGGVKVDLF